IVAKKGAAPTSPQFRGGGGRPHQNRERPVQESISLQICQTRASGFPKRASKCRRLWRHLCSPAQGCVLSRDQLVLGNILLRILPARSAMQQPFSPSLLSRVNEEHLNRRAIGVLKTVLQ